MFKYAVILHGGSESVYLPEFACTLRDAKQAARDAIAEASERVECGIYRIVGTAETIEEVAFSWTADSGELISEEGM